MAVKLVEVSVTVHVYTAVFRKVVGKSACNNTERIYGEWLLNVA